MFKKDLIHGFVLLFMVFYYIFIWPLFYHDLSFDALAH